MFLCVAMRARRTSRLGDSRSTFIALYPSPWERGAVDPRVQAMLFPCVAVRVTVACVTASAALSRRTSGAARADQAARRPWDSVELLHVVSFVVVWSGLWACESQSGDKKWLAALAGRHSARSRGIPAVRTWSQAVAAGSARSKGRESPRTSPDLAERAGHRSPVMAGSIRAVVTGSCWSR